MSKTDTQHHTIVVNQQQEVTCSPSETILECLEANGVDIQYHCREGFCGACRTRLVSGDINYKTAPLAYLDDDEILPCCSVANSDLSLEID